MAINDFIPAVWSATLYEELSRAYVAASNCNRDFDGDIRSCGDTVHINGIDPVNVFTYTKNTDFASTMQTLSSNSRLLTIDQAKAFNFQIDDVDRAQQSPKLMSLAMRAAAAALADEADKYIFGLWNGISADCTVKKTGVTTSQMIDTLLEVRQKLYENNVSGEAVLEVSPAVATRVLKAKILNQTANSEPIEHGYIGSFLGFQVYVSGNIAAADAAGATYYKCFARTKRAVAYAEQISDIEAYRPEKRFADAVKGLHLYGAKIVYENEIVLLDINLAEVDA